MVSYKALNTTTKSVISYLRYRVRNGDALKRFALFKSVISYARYRVWNGDALKRFAPTKSSISYLRYRVRNYIIDAIFYSTNNSCLILIKQANIIILEICWVTINVSIISWLSVLYALNGRKVTVWILIRYEKVNI